MSKKLRRIVLTFFAIQVIAWIVAQIVSKRLNRGDEESDEFRVAALMGGRSFHSHARSLSSGTAIAGMGGIDLDLRDATIDPDGAVLDLNATMGGIQIVVPDGWAVEIAEDSVAGGVDTNVTPAAELPPDAPRLRINAITRMGGALVTTSPSS